MGATISAATEAHADKVAAPIGLDAFMVQHNNKWNIAYFEAMGEHHPELRQMIENDDVYAQRGLIDVLATEVRKTEGEWETKLRELDTGGVAAKMEKQIDTLVAMDAINERAGLSNALFRSLSLAKEGDGKTRAAVLLAMAIPAGVAGYATYKARNPKPKPESFAERAEQAKTAEHSASKA